MTKRWVLCLLAVGLFVPLVVAHQAPRELEYTTRLLHDCEDDYFGDDEPNRPGHDLHALDIREERDGDTDLVVFSVILNGPGAGRVALAFTVDGESSEASWVTQDGSSWTGQGFDAVRGPLPALKEKGVRDGDRFILEGVLSWAALGAVEGAHISNYRLTGSSGGEEGDHVPGYDGTAPPPPIGPGCQREYRTPYSQGYTLEGPVQYATVEVDSDVQQVLLGTERFIDIQVESLLRRTSDARTPDQSVTLRASSAPGVDVAFHDPTTGDYTDAATFNLPTRGSNLIHLAVTGTEAGASGQITVSLTTDLGGHVQAPLTYEVEGGSSGDGGDGGDGGGGDGEEPTPFGLLAPVALLVAVWAARRRP